VNFLQRPKPKFKLGYTTGVFDLFHIGHLNLLTRASSLCDQLIVGVTSDELVEYKEKNSVIPFEERIAIVSSLKCVTTAIPQLSLDKLKQWEKIKFDVLFVGDDWHGNPNWQDVETKLNHVGVKVIYLPYTKSTSSTLINEVLIDLRK
jgi:glycerol-3-phosphate cytidylyltransferase